MTYPDIDNSRVQEIEIKFNVKCVDSTPFKPNDLVRWKCTAKGHEWIASYIDLQILNRCFQCDPKDIEIWGNGTFAQNMSFTIAKLASDLQAGVIQQHSYHHDSQLHASIAAFFFTAVRNEFSLKVMSKENSLLGLGKKKWFCSSYEQFSTVELVNRMYKAAESNIDKFTISGMGDKEFKEKFKHLKMQFVTQVEVRNKIAHGFSFYPITKKTKKYNPSIADAIRLLGAGELEGAYSVGSTFMAVAEKLLNTSPSGISVGNKLLRDYILLR